MIMGKVSIFITKIEGKAVEKAPWQHFLTELKPHAKSCESEVK